MYFAPTSPYTIPKSGPRLPAVMMAVIMHALLAAMLFFGLSWQSSPPEVVEAELWSALPQIAAPTPPPAPPQVVVTPSPPQPVPIEEVAPPPKPDLVIKEETPKKVPPKPPEPVPPPKVEVKVEPKPQPKPEVKTPPAPPSALQYIQNQLATASTGAAARTSGPRGSDAYGNALRAKIRSNTVFPTPAGIEGNPTVVVEIRQLPTGDVTGTRIISSSGLPAFDEAVLSGIEKSSPLPKDDQGRVQSPIQLTYKLFQDR